VGAPALMTFFSNSGRPDSHMNRVAVTVAVKPDCANARISPGTNVRTGSSVDFEFKDWRGRDGNDPSVDIAKDADQRF
jgi:hypothetical protein